MNGRTPKNLLRILDEYFDTVALRELAYEMGTDYENLAGENKRGRFLSLIQYAEHRNRIDDLIELAVEKRPFLKDELERKNIPKNYIKSQKWRKIQRNLTYVVILLISVLILSWVGWQIFSYLQAGVGEKELFNVRVLDEVTNKPIQGAKLTLDLGGQLPENKYTDSNGFSVFAFSSSKAGGVAKLAVQAEGYEIFEDTFNLATGGLPKVVYLRPLH